MTDKECNEKIAEIADKVIGAIDRPISEMEELDRQIIATYLLE